MAKSVTSKRSFVNKKIIFIVLYVGVLLGVAGFGGYYFKKYHDLKSSSPEQLQQAQTDQYIDAVSKLYALPKNEKPDIATVKDKEALKKQYPFFDQAENDDIVLIYKEAKLAILYRPSSKQLIKVGPVNVDSGLSIRTIGSDAERQAVEKTLTDGKLAFTSGGASKTSAIGVTVVDVKGGKTEEAKNLATLLKGKVGTLPAGEDTPTDVDLLVVVGPEGAQATTTP